MSVSKTYAAQDVIADIIYAPADGAITDCATAKQLFLGDKDEHTRAMTIHDMRNLEEEFRLDRNGFQVVKLPARDRDNMDEAIIKSDYYKEMEDEIKKVTGASSVHIFNHLIRAAIKTRDPTIIEYDPKSLGPAGQPHVDFTRNPKYLSALQAPSGNLGAYSELFQTSRRWQLIGTWRPIRSIERDPLAVADASTIPDSDFSIRTRTYPNGMEGANYMLGHGSDEDQHMWYYLPKQRSDELLVMKQFDTEQQRPGWRCAHTGFQLPDTAHLPPRESIEIRAVTFFC